MLCGIAPIRFAGRVDVVEVIKQSAAKGRSRESMRALNGLVVVQFAVSTALLVSAGVLVRSCGVRERARELGIRLALGARPADVRRMVLRQGFTVVGLGLAIGLAGSAALTRVARSTVFGIGSLDAASLAAVCAVLIAAGFAALYLPARWASALEPALTLRSE
jgi:ABC-type lipoprotein release transport system permease subunit